MDYQWYNTIDNSFQSIWMQTGVLLPNIIVAVVLVFIGYLLGNMLKAAVKKIINRFKVTEAINAAGVGPVIDRSGYTFDAGGFIGSLVKWFVILVFFMAALDIVNLYQASAFLYDVVLTYIPKVIIATIIMFAGLTLAGFIGNVVTGAARSANFSASELLGRFAKFAIIFFAVLAALNQLEIAPELVQILFTGMVFGLALAFGLAFGLGGRDAAGRYINNMSRGNDRVM